jgi:hypothetical protein
VRDDLAREGEQIYEYRTGTYWPAEAVGEALVHSSDDYDGTVSVVTERHFLKFDSIDLDYRQGESNG